MTAVKLNHEGVDIVEIRMSTTGSNEAAFTSKENLFNSELNYVFGITDLNVDVSSLPIFPPSTNQVIATLQRRHTGYDDVQLAGFTPSFSILPAGRKYYDTASFFSALSSFANTFSELQDTVLLVANLHGGGADIPAGTQDNEGIPYLTVGLTLQEGSSSQGSPNSGIISSSSSPHLEPNFCNWKT